MSHEVTDYLLRLTTLAVSFVGFSAMVVALRRALGAELSDLHMHFVRMFIEGGLAVAALGLQPVLLSHTPISEAWLWRISSSTAALLFSVYLVTLGKRRRKLTMAPRVTVQIVVNFLVSIGAVVALWVNGIYYLKAAPYLFALTWFLILGGWVFTQNLDRFLRSSSEGNS